MSAKYTVSGITVRTQAATLRKLHFTLNLAKAIFKFFYNILVLII